MEEQTHSYTSTVTDWSVPAGVLHWDQKEKKKKDTKAKKKKKTWKKSEEPNTNDKETEDKVRRGTERKAVKVADSGDINW